MRWFLSAVLTLAAVTALSSSPVVAQQIPGPHLSGDRLLSNLGVYRPSQVLRLLETVSWMTVNGFDLEATSPASVWEPTISIGGIPFRGSVFGRMHLNTVPLDPALWDSVIVSHAPRIEWGGFTPEPVIDIVPRRPDTSFSTTAGAWVANGVGDPGPYQYVDSSLYNVERIGPGAHATVSYGGASWFFETHVLGRRHGLLSPIVSPRLNRVYAGPHQTPRMRTASIKLRTGLEAGRSRYEGRASRTVTDDFLFLEAVGHEIPTQLQTSTVQVSGTSTVATNLDVAFGASYVGTETGRRPGSRLDWSLDWRESRSHVFGEVLVGVGKVGAAFTRHHGWGPGMDGGESVYLPAVYASGHLNLSGGVSQKAGVHVTLDDDVAPAFWAVTAFRPTGDLHFDVAASAGYRLFSQRPSLWYWHARGYYLADRAGVRVGPFDPSTRTSFGTLHLRANATLISGMKVSAGTYGSLASNANVVSYRFQTDALSDELTGFVTLNGDASGGAWGATLAVESRPFEHLYQRIGYAYSIPLGSSSYRRILGAKPRHRVVGTALVEPNDRFGLAAVLRIESATQWPAYSEAAEMSDLYVDRLPARVNLDLTVFKRLWGPHLDAGLTVRNVLGSELRYHPLGVQHPTTLSVRLVVRA